MALSKITTSSLTDGSVSNVKVGTGIDSVKIGAGDVSNTEHAFLNSVSSNVQTQISGASGPQFKFLTGSWDISTTGTFNITGVGFAPKQLTLVSVKSGTNTANIALANSDGTEFSLYDQHHYAAHQWGLTFNTKIVSLTISGSAFAFLEITAWGSDGISMTKTTSGSPSGTGYYGITFFG